MEFKIIIKRINNSLSNEEELVFHQWINESDKHRQYFENVKKNYNNEISIIDMKQSWKSLNQKINERNHRPIKNPQTTLWKIAAVAASVAIVIGISFLLINQDPIRKSMDRISQNKIIISPGSHKAILTLSNGQQVLLGSSKNYNLQSCNINKNQVIYNQNGKKDNADKISYNEISTPLGGEYQIVLADGTRVWLNADSKLKYPESFMTGKNREVELVYGEAYFEVSPANKHNGSHFLVKTDQQVINVIGTEFNIRAYAKERTISTTLVKGIVNVSIGTSKQTLMPAQQANFDKERTTLTKESVDIYDIIAWKDGIFSFTDKPLDEIATVLERWYNVKIIIENDSMKKIRFSGVFSKDQDLNSILNIIQKTNIIKYQSNKEIVILK